MPSYCGRRTMSVVAGHKYADMWFFGSKSKTTKAFAFLEAWFSGVYGFPRHSFCRVPTLRKPGELSQSRNCDAYIQGNYYVEILHMWDMSTTRNRLCMRCGLWNFDVKLENFTMKIHCFRWCMMHLATYRVKKRVFFQKHVIFFIGLDPSMIGWLFLRRCFLDSQQLFLVFFSGYFCSFVWFPQEPTEGND